MSKKNMRKLVKATITAAFLFLFIGRVIAGAAPPPPPPPPTPTVALEDNAVQENVVSVQSNAVQASIVAHHKNIVVKKVHSGVKITYKGKSIIVPESLFRRILTEAKKSNG